MSTLPPPPAPTQSPPRHAPPPGAPPRRLVRLRDQAKVGGVAAGLGWYLGVDPTLVRIGLVVLTIATGAGIPAYLIAWVVLPEARSGDVAMVEPPRQRDARSLVIAAAGIGALLVLLGQVDLFSGQVLAAAVLIGIGILLFTDGEGWRHGWPAAPPTPPPPPPPPSVDRSGWGPRQSAYRSYAAGGSVAPTAWRQDAAPRGPLGQPPPPPRPPGGAPPQRPRSALGLLGFAVWLAAVGLTSLLVGAAEPSVRDVLGLTLLAVGGTLLVGTLIGRARWLVVVGALAALLLVPASALQVSGIDLRGGVGARAASPTSVDELPDEYRLLAGEQVIDLTRLDVAGQTARVRVSMGAGELQVRVPDDVQVVVTGTLSAGDRTIFGEERDGTDVPLDAVQDAAEGRGRIELDISVGVGEVRVEAIAVNRPTRATGQPTTDQPVTDQ